MPEQSLTNQGDAATALSSAIWPREQCAYPIEMRKTHSRVYSHRPCLLCGTAALQGRLFQWLFITNSQVLELSGNK